MECESHRNLMVKLPEHGAQTLADEIRELRLDERFPMLAMVLGALEAMDL